MKDNIIVLIDGGFFEKRYPLMNTKSFIDADKLEEYIFKTIDEIKKINKYSSSDFELKRIFYYDCLPYGKEAKSYHNPPKIIDFSKNSIYEKKMKYLESLKTKDFFALRLGTLTFRGWSRKVKTGKSGKIIPVFNQKGVDIKIGLDMAWTAMKGKSSKILLIAGDSDFISPMKFVRKEGMTVYLDIMEANFIKNEMLEHADFIINKPK